MDIGIVERYWKGVADRLRIEADVLNQVIGHNLTKGEANEASLIRLLEGLLPRRYGLGGGLVFDRTGKQSGQLDVILFDRVNQPALLAQTAQSLFAVKVVECLVEVKTRAKSQHLRKDFVDSLQRMRQLSGGEDMPFAFFAYDCQDSPHSVLSALKQTPLSSRPTFGCILNPGIYWTSLPSESLGYVPLKNLDPSGAAGGDGWSRSSAPTTLVIDGHVYPVFKTEAGSQDYVVGDPGRTLLLFCQSLWRVLGGPDGDFDWVGEYLSEDFSRLYDP